VVLIAADERDEFGAVRDKQRSSGSPHACSARVPRSLSRRATGPVARSHPLVTVRHRRRTTAHKYFGSPDRPTRTVRRPCQRRQLRSVFVRHRPRERRISCAKSILQVLGFRCMGKCIVSRTYGRNRSNVNGDPNLNGHVRRFPDVSRPFIHTSPYRSFSLPPVVNASCLVDIF